MSDQGELAKLLHERFASEFQDHWDDLDEQEQGDSEFNDMAQVIVTEFLTAHDEQVRAAAIREAANALPGSIPGRDRVNEWLWQYSATPAEQKESN